jgi:hypothetical protein
VLYSAISLPTSADPSHGAFLLTAEALLEQTFCQHRPGVLVDAVEALERVALQQLQAVSRGTYHERCDMDTHVEYDGVPIVSTSDLCLILLLTRCTSSSTASRGTGQFLGDFANVEQLVCARAFLVVLLCMTCIDLMENDQPEHATVSPDVLVTYTVLPPRASKQLSFRIVRAVNDVLGATSSAAVPAGSGSSSHTSSWLPAARAASLISFVEILIRNFFAVVRVSVVGAMQILSAPQGALAYEAERCGSALCQDIISSLVCTVFVAVPESRLSTVHLLLSNTLAYACKTSDASSSIKKLSTTSKKMFMSIGGPQHGHIFWAATSLIGDLCTMHTSSMASLAHAIETYLPAITLLPPAEMEKAVLPLTALVSCSTPFLSAMMTLLRKSLLHPDPEKISFAVRTFVLLIPLVPQHTQIEIVQTVLHVLSMPVCYQTLLYQHVALLCTSEADAHRLAPSAAQHLLAALTARLDTYFTSSSGRDKVRTTATGLFDPSLTVERGAGQAMANNFNVLVNMQYLLGTVYHLEKYLDQCTSALSSDSTVNCAGECLRSFVATRLSCENDEDPHHQEEHGKAI